MLLRWEAAGKKEVVTYSVLNDGIEIARTQRLSLVMEELSPNRMYRFSVRATSANGDVLASSAVVEAKTKALGELLDVRTRGARGDGQTDDTAAIQSAISACPPGGTVMIPAGHYRVGHLNLKSDLTLHLASGCRLEFFDRERGNYPESVLELPGPDGPVSVSFGALITGIRTNNVSITGHGIIAANGASWWKEPKLFRPKVLEIIDSAHLLVQGITVEDPPFWNIHPTYVDDAVFADVKFLKRSTAPSTNGDGLNPDSCRDVQIIGCSFGNQDDSIALKSGKLTPTQPRRQRACENIEIFDCRFDGELAPGAHPLGIAIGSETCGGIFNVLIRDCEFRDVASIVNIKSNRDRRHGVVKGVKVQRCSYTNHKFHDEPWNRAPISLDLFYYSREENPNEADPSQVNPPFFQEISFQDISIINPVGRAAYLTGLGEKPLRDITFTNLVADSETGMLVRNVDGLTLEAIRITSREGPAIATAGIIKNYTTFETPTIGGKVQPTAPQPH